MKTRLFLLTLCITLPRFVQGQAIRLELPLKTTLDVATGTTSGKESVTVIDTDSIALYSPLIKIGVTVHAYVTLTKVSGAPGGKVIFYGSKNGRDWEVLWRPYNVMNTHVPQNPYFVAPNHWKFYKVVHIGVKGMESILACDFSVK